MKKIYFTLALLLSALYSCSGFLDQDNRSNVPSDQFYKTTTGFASLTNSAYSTLRELYNTQPQLFVAGTDLYADGKSQGVVMSQYTFTADEGNIKNFYVNCFKGIQLANSVIHYGDITEDSNVRLQYVDEARFLRAWYYFQLVQQFGPVALNKEMFDYAVMSHARTSLSDIYDFLISEFTYLESSESNLLERTNSGVERANKRAAAFYLAKVYLTRGWLDGQSYESQEANIAQSTDFANAAKYALEAINSETPSISLESAFDVENEENSEIFWSIQFSGASVEDPVADGSYQQAQFGSYLGGSEKPLNKAIDGNFAPSLRLQQLYTHGDARLEQTFMLEFHKNYFDYYTAPTTSPIIYYYAPAWATDADIVAWKADDPYGLKQNTLVSKTIATGGIAPSNGAAATYKDRRSQDYGTACIKKFDDYSEASISNRNSTCSMHDVVVARLGEAYLIAAEAYIKQSKPGEAANMINLLRQRPGTVRSGYTTPMTVSVSDMSIDFILDERAREMAGEYVRWTDLKRTHKLVQYVTQYNEDGVKESAMIGTDGKYKTLRPIPQAAIDLNQADVEQNPGY
ncbi:MAG: RagB/SusD family nutrient uptake outer membrane protein [Bacteroides sp.]|jgi:hypothetical protein|nr:RagB/SusD family nutrient uptake outer membrane protein [Bacteroides sp.]MCI1682420.1 RagB/SusD family nutrient uptake outer membrane protein [Bacteroides sp.]